jgi:hypothetical protein
MFTTVNDIGFQHKMDEVKAEPESDTDIQAMFLASDHRLLDMNDGQIPFHVLQKGIKVSVFIILLILNYWIKVCKLLEYYYCILN